MIDVLIKLLLFTVLILQIILLTYMLISTIKRNREDKKFWDGLHKEIEESQHKCLSSIEKDLNITLKEEKSEQNK